MNNSIKYSSLNNGDYDDDFLSKNRRGNYSSRSSNSSFNNIFGNKSRDRDDEMGGSSSSMVFKSMIKDQDDNLEKLEESTNRLSDMSLSMSKEIDMQNK